MTVIFVCVFFFFFKQKTAYEMRISDWSSDVCSSDLRDDFGTLRAGDKCDLFHGRASFVDNIYQGRTSPKWTSLPLVPLASSSASATLVRAPSLTSISPPP